MPDQDRTKKILFALIIAIVVILVGYAFYRFVLSRATNVAPAKTTQPLVEGRIGQQTTTIVPPGFPSITPIPPATEGLQDQIKEQILLALTDFPVTSPVINKNQDKIIFYKKDGGTMFSADFTGKLEKLSNLTIIGLAQTLWSPARDRGAVFYIDQETLKSFLHIGTSTVLSLPYNIKSLSWSPDGKSFAYLLEQDTILSLIISDATGKNSKVVFKTPILDAQIQWITADKIAFQTAPSANAQGFIFIYSRANGSFRRILGPTYGLDSLWSPDGSHVLAISTSSNGKKLQLSLYSSSGQEQQKLTFATLPEKCAWQNLKEFYCAVPKEIPDAIMMPDDYLRAEFATQDYILSYNIETKDTRKILEGGAMDMTNLGITKNNDYLIFVNRTDGILWRLKLK